MSSLSFSSRPSLPSILQAEKSECGLACLAMILNYHGHRIDIGALRARYSISQHGLSLKGLMSLADKVQLCSRPLRLELRDIPQLKLPAILHWDMNHFVVLSAVKKDKYIIHDPAAGMRVHTEASLSKHFTGVALELNPAAGFSSKVEETRLKFTDLWSRTSGLKQSIAQILLLSVIMQGFALAMPFYSQTVIDDVLVRYDLDLLTILALGFLLITLINIATDCIRSFVILHMSNSLGFQLAANLNRHLLKLPLEYFTRRHIGDIVSRFGSIFKVKDFITSGIIEVFVDGLMVLATFVLILLYSPKLCLVVGVLLLINTAAKFSLYSALRRENEELIALSASENTTFMENIRAIQGIKLFNRETDRNAVWQNVFAEVSNKSIQVQKINIYIRISRALIYGIEGIVIVWLAARQVIDGQLSIGMMMAFLSYKDQLYRRFFALVDKYFDFKILGIHLGRLADIAHTMPEQNALAFHSPASVGESKCLLELKDLSFRYSDEGPYLFQHVNLQINEGESVAIVGPTGCGKSSLLKLILSLYRPSEGAMNMEGMAVAAGSLEQYRNQVSAVLQDDSLLSGSIFENISFFDSNPSRERVEQAARQAAIAGDISRMPMQYETLVGNMGAALSGGQIQRILLARAFYKNCKLVVLDEATSHLDLQTEATVNDSIKTMKVARIMVAHRPQSFLLADRIYRLTPQGLVKLDKQQLQAQIAVAGVQ